MGALTIKLYDLQSNELADISEICLDKSLKRILDGPRALTLQAIANHDLMTDVPMGGDGHPNLWEGNRKLIVWEDGITNPIFHGRVTRTERVGTGGKLTPVTILAFDPAATELGYDADGRAGRVVRGSTVAGGTYDGNFIQPKFVSSVDGGAAISGPDLIKQILENSQNTGAESDPSPGEGPLPIDLTTGDFDLNVPPAIDLSPLDSMDWPLMVGDFIQQLVATGVCDFDMRPVDPTEGFDPYIMVALSAVSSFGTDRHATVHFDYLTGSHNAQGARLIRDFATVCNKLYDYLGPRKSQTRWAGNITPGSPGTTIDPSASRTLFGGQFMQIREFDSIGSESSSRPLYIASWNAEQGYRLQPRPLLYVTPADGDNALFDAMGDYDVGDLISINTGSEFGIELAEEQRVYGFTKTWTRENITQVSELVTSADVSLA